MSDTGLYSALYQRIRECAELVDGVLIGLKQGLSSTKDKPQQELGRFLVSLADGPCEDLSTRVVMLVLRDKGDITKTELSRAGAALLSGSVDRAVIDILERLARSLEQEQAGAMERLRGWYL